MTTTPEPAAKPLPMRRRNPPINAAGPPSRASKLSIVFIAVGYLVGLAVPSFIVSPGELNASTGSVVLAFGFTVLGVVIALVAGFIALRRTGNFAWLIITAVPSVAIVAGGAILAGTKLSG